MASLVQRLLAAGQGREEWRIVSPDGSGIVMWFSRTGPDPVLDPEREARKWLEDHQRDYPQRFAGYMVEQAVTLSSANALMREAAAELERADAQVLRAAADITRLRNRMVPDISAKNLAALVRRHAELTELATAGLLGFDARDERQALDWVIRRLSSEPVELPTLMRTNHDH